MALEALLKALKEDDGDQNLLKAVLETLTNLCTHDSSSPAVNDNNAGGGDPHHQSVAGAQSNNSAADKFSLVILQDKEDVISTFLELLGDSDFYIRYYTVQLLGALHVCSGEELQQRVLVSPTGVGRLVDLLSDQRDIIRNEGIQLLIAMTRQNADIQKIVAFENAFDRLLGIVDEEGGVRGNIIVQDCLQLLHNLLNYNVSNQNFFRETSGIQRLPSLLVTDPSQTAAGRNGGKPAHDEDEDLEWTAQHARNMLVVLDIIRMLIQTGNTNTDSNQTAMQQCGIIPPLLQLALANEAPASVRSQALYAIGDIIRAHQANQNLFQRILITAATPDSEEQQQQGGDDERAIPEPAIVIVIRLSVGKRPANMPASEYFIVRAAAAFLVQAYVGNNPDAQLALAATLTPPGDVDTLTEPERHQSAGSMIVSVLLDWRATSREDIWRVWYSSLLLSTILHGSVECKEQALKISLGDQSKGEEPFPLINEIMSQARQATQQGADPRVSISLLTLICVWLANFPRGVAIFLDESSNISFIVEQINGSSGVDALVQGISAFLFGIAYQFDVDPDTPMNRENLYPILSKRVGTDQLLIRVKRLRDSKEFQYAVGLAAGTYSSAYGGIASEIYFDNVFTDMFKQNYEGFRVAVRLGPNEVMSNPSFAHLQGGGGMTASYPSSVISGNSIPGSPMLAGATTISRSESPAAAAVTGMESSQHPEGQVVSMGEYEALNNKLNEQTRRIAELESALKETKSDESSNSLQLLEQERQARTQAEMARDDNAKEIEALRRQLEEVQLSSVNSTAINDDDVSKQLESLKLEHEQREAEWKQQNEDLQKKVSNAEKNLVKANAASRNTNKKKEEQQTAEIERLKSDNKTKDEQIAKLNEQVKKLTEKAQDAGAVDEMKSKIAGLEKEQEDLLVYLADQDQQAKEYRAKLRKHGEDIPLSDDGEEEDEE